jgi:hypothetical protein
MPRAAELWVARRVFGIGFTITFSRLVRPEVMCGCFLPLTTFTLSVLWP